MSNRQKISAVLSRVGVLRALEQLPTRPGLVVFNHHRIGNHNADPYDRNLFSASAEQFDSQLSYIKRHFPVLLPHELADLFGNNKPLTRLHAMITFDDGYLDNYTLAFDLLKHHDLRAAFFLVSTFVGTAHVPWWDEVAYLVRHSPASSLTLASLQGTAFEGMTFNLAADREAAVDDVLQAYKSSPHPDEVLKELRVVSRVEARVDLPHGNRRFLDWAEAREMADAGMEIGAHTHTHPFLGKLSPPQQETELRTSKAILEENMRRPVTSLAYPNGSPADFNGDTRRIAAEAGYTTAFSYYGGVNPALIDDPYNVLRITPDREPGGFRIKAILMSRFTSLESALRNTYHRLRPQP